MTSELPMMTMNNRLALSILNRKKRPNVLEKGFTLVELMIVVVIVGVLSAVALPNFLAQSDKAKMTEAKTLNTASLKEAQAFWIESGADGLETWADSDTDNDGGCPVDTTNFEFACDDADTSAISVTATGTAASGNLDGLTVVSTLDVTSGGAISLCGTAEGLEECS